MTLNLSNIDHFCEHTSVCKRHTVFMASGKSDLMAGRCEMGDSSFQCDGHLVNKRMWPITIVPKLQRNN